MPQSFPGLGILLGFVLLLCPGELIGARSGAGAAKDAVGSFNHFVDIHALYQLGNPLGIAGAAAEKADIGQLVVYNIKSNLAGTCALGRINHWKYLLNINKGNEKFPMTVCKSDYTQPWGVLSSKEIYSC